jgi:hypothetical protein
MAKMLKMRWVALIAVIGVGSLLNSTPVLAAGGCPCEGVCWTDDGCVQAGGDVFNCVDAVQKAAEDACFSGGWCEGSSCVAD